MIYTIRGLTENSRGVTIRVRILSKDQVSIVKTKNGEEHRVVEIEIGDQTGIILLSLWDKMIDLVNEGDLIDIENGYVNRFKGRLRLNVGRFGKLDKVEDPSFPKAEELSQGRWTRS